MRGARILWCVVAGCGSSNPASIDAPHPSPDVAIDGAPPSLSLTGTIHEWMSPTTPGPALAGATVCLYGATQPNCATADGSGSYTLDHVPTSSDVGITASKTGYLSTLVLIKSPAANAPPLDIAIVTDAVLQQKLQDAGGSYPLAGTAIVEVGAFVVSGNGAAPASDVTDAMTPVSGVGPAYLGSDGYPSSTLTATSAEGGAMFVNVTAGSVDVSVMLAAKTCATSQYDGWHGTTAGTVRMPAVSDTLTYISVVCL